jgi:hypothetical protein
MPENRQPERLAPRARSNRTGGRDHLGILGEIKSVHPGEIIGISIQLSPSLAFHRSLVQRSPDSVCKLDGVVVGPKVDEEHARLFVEHMTVNRRYLDIASTQRADERIDLAVRY